MNPHFECKFDGCCESALRKFVVMERDSIVREALSCGLHDIKVYRQLTAIYMPDDYKIEIKVMEDGKWKNCVKSLYKNVLYGNAIMLITG